MRRRTRALVAVTAVAIAGLALSACGGRTDGGNPGNPAGDTTTTIYGTETTG